MLEYKMRDYIEGISMNIIEVKNNLVRLSYEEDLRLSGLIKISDNSKSYIAQVLHLDANRTGKNAVAKIIFNYDGQIRGYDGSIPSLKAVAETFDMTEMLSTIKCENPVVIGKIAGKKENFAVDFDVLKENPIILSEKFYTTKFLLNNIAMHLQARKQKLVVFDTAGVFRNGSLTLSKDFKLPLNHSAINCIYNKGFLDATDESKAFIQSIFEELGEYAKTVDFIPFDTFKSVVDSEFARTKLIQLVVMKNKLKQIRDKNIFAQRADEFEVLKNKLSAENTVIINLSGFASHIQKECISYVYSLLKEIGAECYAFTPLESETPEKEYINELFSVENVHTTVICDYNYADLSELKKISKNMLMFTPIKQQKDFGGYNIFLQKLAEDEFIAFGKMTKFVPIICKLFQISSSDIILPKVEVKVEPAQPEQISVTAEVPIEEVNEIKVEELQTTENVTNEQADVAAEIESDVDKDEIPETFTEEIQSESGTEIIQTDSVPEIVNAEAPMAEEIEAPEPNTIDVPEVEISMMAGASAQEVTLPQNIQPEGVTLDEVGSEQAQNQLQEALEQVPDIDDDEELSDDDLDMIEKLSKPDEEIPVINDEYTAQEVYSEPVVEQAEDTELPQEQENQIIQEPEQPQEQEAIQDSVQEQSAPMEEELIQTPPETEPLQMRASSTPTMPEYSAEIPEEDKVRSDVIGQGDRVYHEEFGEGVVEKMINYGDKLLCSINFATVGRRLLNPEISEMRKI